MSKTLPEGTFILGGEEFEIPPRGINFTGQWKDNHLEPIIELVYGMENIDLSVTGENAKMDGEAVKKLMQDFRPLLNMVVDLDKIIVEAVVEWIHPETKEDRDHLLERSFPSDFVEPLEWLVGKVYPLARVQRMFGGAPETIGTPLNSPNPNGAGPKRKRGRKK